MSKDTVHYLNPVSLKNLVANGYVGSAGQALLSNGTGIYWGSGVGFAGSRGDKGEPGEFGGASFYYKWSTDIFIEEIEDGYVLLTNTNFVQATIMGISTVDRNDTDLTAFIQTIDDSTSDIKGSIKFSEEANSANFTIFNITGTHIDHGNHFDIPVAYVSGNTTPLANATNVVVSFVVFNV